MHVASCQTEKGQGGRRHHSLRWAFTLVELLVVVAIIAILLAILVPAIQRARELAQQAVCASNEKQMMVAAAAYASDQRGRTFPFQQANIEHFPGTDVAQFIALDAINEPAHRPNWLFGLRPYLDKISGSSEALRCPSVTLVSGGNTHDFSPTDDDANSYVANGVITQFGGRNFNSPASVVAVVDDVSISNAAILRPHWTSSTQPNLEDAFWSGWMRFDIGLLLTDRPHDGKNLAFLDGHVEHQSQPEITSADFGLLIDGQDTYEPDVPSYTNPLRRGAVMD